MLEAGAKFKIPAWTNNGLVSLADETIRDSQTEMARGAKELMQLYAALGCRTVWTCAPYQLPGGPGLGDHIVVGESNAVSFYNAVVGARTNKYGDYLDVACGLTGYAPRCGLHTDAGRRARMLIDTSAIPDSLKRQDIYFHLLGTAMGEHAGKQVPAIDALEPDVGEDALKAISAAAAAAGGVEHWHGIGRTPEAPDRNTAFAGLEPDQTVSVTLDTLSAARRSLTSARDGPVEMVALGTPHFSFTEFASLVPMLQGRTVHPGTKLYISTSRHVRDLAAQNGWIECLEVCRCADHRRYLHLFFACGARLQGPRHDQCRQMGLVCTRHAGCRSVFRVARGVRRNRRQRRGVARCEPVAGPGLMLKLAGKGLV